KGSMELMEDIDPEEARAIVDPALKLMIEAVHRYDGYIVQSTGDGIMAIFGAPVAHEDHPQRPIRSFADAGRDAQLCGWTARRRQPADRSPRRSEHRRGGGPFDCNWRGPRGIHTNRPFSQPRGANAGDGADRIGSGDRAGKKTLRGLLRFQGSGSD